MTLTRAILALLAIALLGFIVYAALNASFTESFGAISADLWGLVSLFDLYLGFIVAAVLIFFLEPNPAMRWAAIIPLFFIGNPWLAGWAVLRLPAIVRRLKS